MQYEKFIEDVLSGKQIACKKIRQACERHMRDLEKSVDPEYPFYFDSEWADNYISFMKDLTMHQGKVAGQKFPMLPFQEFIVAMTTGWRKKKNRKRRFREVYIQMAKKNAKTTLMAGLVLAIFYLEPDASGQYVFCADSQKQATLCFDMTVNFAKKLKEEDEDVDSITHLFRNSVTRSDFNSSIKAFPRDPKKTEGLGANVVVVDEWHVHQTDKLKQSLRTGQNGREDPLLIDITTAGDNLGGPCHEQYDYCAEVLEGNMDDDELLALIFEKDKDDDWKSMDALYKANPAIEGGGTPDLDATLLELKTAINRGGRLQQDYRTKVLNEWVATSTVWIPHDKWMECCRVVEPKGLGYQGLDLAFKNDFAAIADYYPEAKTFRRHLFLPSWKVDAKDDYVDYRKWVDDGHIHIAGRETIDYSYIEQFIRTNWKPARIKAMYYDPHTGHQMGENLERDGFNVKAMAQSYGNMTPPIMELERLVFSKALSHTGDPVFNWMMSNAEVLKNSAGYMKLSKSNSRKKIDGPVALLMALVCATNEAPKKSKVSARMYDAEGNLINLNQGDEA